MKRTIGVIPINDYEAVTAMTVSDLLDIATPARSFLPNAKLNPIEQRQVDRLRSLRDLIQRDFTGEKKRNAQGPLANYIRDEWLGADDGPPPGFLGTFIVYFPTPLDIADGEAQVQSRGVFVDGESRGEGLLINVERLPDVDLDHLLQRRVGVHIVHGIEDPKVIAKYFADVNGKGVGVNPNLVVMADYTDPYADLTKRVFEALDLALEMRQRQVRAKSEAVLTGLQARTMVAAVAKGVGVVQYGSKPLPNDIDFARLEEAATGWLTKVFDALGQEAFRDRGKVLRAVPVAASLAALGRPYFDGGAQEQALAEQKLRDESIDWAVGPHWSGIAGRFNPASERFAVGGGKEYAYATWRAITEPETDAGKQIRHRLEGQH